MFTSVIIKLIILYDECSVSTGVSYEKVVLGMYTHG